MRKLSLKFMYVMPMIDINQLSGLMSGCRENKINKQRKRRKEMDSKHKKQ